MRQEKEINRNCGIGHGTDGERSLKEASDFVAHVLQLSIKLRSHDD